MAISARRPGISRSFAASASPTAGLNYAAEASENAATTGLTALSVEFVAKPEKAESAPDSLLGAITAALQEVSGFAGCLVMVSDQEARLITVVTFWAGTEAQKTCRENIQWIQALLASKVDRYVRVKTMLAHLPALPRACAATETTGAGCPIEERIEKEENTCAA